MNGEINISDGIAQTSINNYVNVEEFEKHRMDQYVKITNIDNNISQINTELENLSFYVSEKDKIITDEIRGINYNIGDNILNIQKHEARLNEINIKFNIIYNKLDYINQEISDMNLKLRKRNRIISWVFIFIIIVLIYILREVDILPWLK